MRHFPIVHHSSSLRRATGIRSMVAVVHSLRCRPHRTDWRAWNITARIRRWRVRRWLLPPIQRRYVFVVDLILSVRRFQLDDEVEPQLSLVARSGAQSVKIAVLAYRVLHETAPRYLGPLVRVSDLPGRRALSSARTNRLVIPPFKLSTIGSRTFEGRSCSKMERSTSTRSIFCYQLKTHLFRQFYPDIVM